MPCETRATMLLRLFIENRVGIIDVDQYFALYIILIEQIDRTVLTVYWHMAHLSTQFLAKPPAIISSSSQSAIKQYAIRLFHHILD